jgi:CheY-like chemotaxis protein
MVMSVLVVDDDTEIRSLITALLTEEGYTVASATNGRRALNYLRIVEPRPCLILLDLMMPDVNGWELLDVLQGDAVFGDIPIVVISAMGTFATARVLGARECLHKPLDLDEVLALVQRYCTLRSSP